MAYKRVYSPDGEPFDVPEARANDLILQSGWTQQPVVKEQPKEEAPAPKKTSRRRKKVEAPKPVDIEEPEDNNEDGTAFDSEQPTETD